MPDPDAAKSALARPGAIWLWALGYFACYAPYSALTKALSSGALPGGRTATGLEILPLSTLASLGGMAAFMALTGWWRHASRVSVLGLSLPAPGRWTLLSGLCTAAIIATTTLSYSFHGTSIVFMMLLMRGGVLVIAPIVDVASKRPVRAPSWLALGLSLAAAVVASARREDLAVTALAAADVAVYLAAYFVRLRFMSHLAKGSPGANRRFFVEEQLVAAPAVVLFLALVASLGGGPIGAQLRAGFVGLDAGTAAVALVIGVLSQGTGVFGALILLDPRENSFCIPVNRASSILAGVVATATLWLWLDGPPISTRELLGAALVTAAIAVLAVSAKPRPSPAAPAAARS